MNRMLVNSLVIMLVSLSPVTMDAEKRSTELIADRADVVVVGEVVAGNQTGRLASFRLRVDQVLKGPVSRGSVVAVQWSASAETKRDPVGSYGLMFLNESEKLGSEYVMLGLAFNRLPFELSFFSMAKPSDSVHETVPTGSLSDKMAYYLGWGIEGYENDTQLFNLSSGLLGIGNGGDSTINMERQMSASADPEIRFVGLAGLVVGGEMNALAEIATDSGGVLLNSKVRGLVGMAIQTVRDENAATIDSLGKVAESKDQSLQRAAALSLEAIHNRETLPFLARLLESQDSQCREMAVRGMNDFVENLPVQKSTNIPGTLNIPRGATPYRTADTDKHTVRWRRPGSDIADDSELLQFWRSWWIRMRPQLGPNFK